MKLTINEINADKQRQAFESIEVISDDSEFVRCTRSLVKKAAARSIADHDVSKFTRRYIYSNNRIRDMLLSYPSHVQYHVYLDHHSKMDTMFSLYHIKSGDMSLLFCTFSHLGKIDKEYIKSSQSWCTICPDRQLYMELCESLGDESDDFTKIDTLSGLLTHAGYK